MSTDAVELSAYGPEERANIVRLGIFLHEQGREFWSSHYQTLPSSSASSVRSLSDEFAVAHLSVEVNAL